LCPAPGAQVFPDSSGCKANGEPPPNCRGSGGGDRARSRQLGLTSAPMVPTLCIPCGAGTTQDRLLPALMAHDGEQPHALGTHVLEGHRVADRSCAPAGEDTVTAGSESCRAPLRRVCLQSWCRHAEPCAMALGAQLVSRKRRGYSNMGRARKRMLAGLQRGARRPAVLIAISRNGAAMAAFGERWGNRPARLWIAGEMGCCASG
jgi:hypothetical protein